MTMTTPSRNYKLQVLVFAALACILMPYSFIQLEQATDALEATEVRSVDLYIAVLDPCEMELSQCRSPLLESDSAPSNGSQTRQLRTTSLRHRRLTQDMLISTPIPSLHCLEQAWKNQSVNPACSFVMDQLENTWDLQHEQELYFATARKIFSAIWMFFLCGTNYFHIQNTRRWFRNKTGRDVWGGNLIFPCFLLLVAHFGFFAANCVICMFPLFLHYYGNKTKDDCCIKDGCSQDSKQECSSGAQQTDVCCCCKNPSDDPSALAGSSCECCSDEHCRDTRAVSDSETEKEILVADPVVEENAL